MLTPAMRANSSLRLALPLLVTRVRADHEHDAAPPDHPATLTHRLHGRSYLHRPFSGSYLSAAYGEGPNRSSSRAAGANRPSGRPGNIATKGLQSSCQGVRMRGPSSV